MVPVKTVLFMAVSVGGLRDEATIRRCRVRVLQDWLAGTSESAQNQGMTSRTASPLPHPLTIPAPAWLEALYDAVPDTVFFIKDAEGRYTAANQTLASRLGLPRKAVLLGKTARDVFPGVLGERYATQDETVLATGEAISGMLELHIYPGGAEGWCLTWKMPVTDEKGRVVGLAGMSRDLPAWSVMKPENRKLARVIEHIHRHLTEPMRIPDLAAMAGLSPYQLDTRVRQLFGVSTRNSSSVHG